MIRIRRAAAEDLPEVAGIQAACPEAAHWDPVDYLAGDLRVAMIDGRVAGFLAGREIAGTEYEILNLAVAPGARRKGVAKSLMDALFAGFKGTILLEVRQSNAAALAFYKAVGFQQLTCRKSYYSNPSEPAIVMKFHSC